MPRRLAIESGQLNALTRLARRLHTEQRMDGNDMRDAGHLLAAIVKTCKELPIPEEFFVG